MHARTIRLLLLLLLLAAGPAAAQEAPRTPRNVILFISDGGGPAAFTMARDYVRDYLGGEGLAIDAMLVGAARTYSTDSRVTDSAAGATAFASGIKTYNGAIGVDTLKRPVATVLEAAEARGMATGLVATSRITHATPAAFAAHVPDRGMEGEIAAQMAAQGVDVVFGGGRRFFLPAGADGSRKDDRDLLAELKAQGYDVALSRDDFAQVTSTPVVGLFAMDHLAYEIDRDTLVEPSLAEMTARAIDLLDDDPDGFFLMVEGSRIDHAGHNNDAAAELHDVLAYDRAIATALDYARRNGETLIISVSDHETGGLSLGRNVREEDRLRAVYGWRPEVLAQVTSSLAPMLDALLSGERDPVEVMQTYAGIDDLSERERTRIEQALAGEGRLDRVVADIISERAVIGWTTGGHTAVDVNLYAFGPGSRRLRGNQENAAVGRIIGDLLGLDLRAVTDQLRQAP